MADTTPLKIASGRTQQFATGDTVPIANGGTGATTEEGARSNLAVAGTGVSNTFTQPQTIQATSDAATLGSELVTNGTFTGNADGWTLGTNWAYGTDNVIVTLGAGAIGTLTQTITVVSGTSYLIEWSQTNSVANNGTIRPSIGAANGIYVSPTATSAGTMSQVVTANTTGTVALTFAVTDATSAGTITIDSVTVKAITPIDATLVLKDTGAATQVEMRVANSASDSNDAFGINTLKNNTTGYSNTAIGKDSLSNLTSGYRNVGLGNGALRLTTTGHTNMGIGFQALQACTTGHQNTAIGTQAATAITTGFSNVAIGRLALFASTTGNNNTAIGSDAMRLSSTARKGVAVGSTTLYDLTTGESNTAIGYNTGRGITTGSYNTIIGASVTGLAAGLTNNVILATGQGTIRGQFDGTNWTFQGAVLVGDGSASAPSIANSDHTGTGLFFGANTLSASTAGVSRWTLNADGSFTNQAGASGTIAVLGDGPSASPTKAELGSAAYASLSQAQDQTSIGWKDMLAPVSGALPGPSNAPVKATFGPSPSKRLEYKFDIDDYVTIQPFHVNHDIVPGARAYLHVHWSTDNTNTSDVTWEMQVMRAKGHNQANFAAPQTITVTGTPHGTAWRHYVTEVTAEADVLILTEPDEQILVVLTRVTNGGTDNTDDVFATQVDLHYESRIHHTPNKAPNFYGET